MITREEINNIALLSKLFVAENEMESFRTDMEQMMQFAQCVADADTANINTDDTASSSPMRQDKIGTSLTVQEALANTDASCDGYFVVKKNG
ncbi:MAG: Asp-tRNA(Asn)/Glu-tRNA(Gln) amidotransferase subunit GatC [Ruminococcus sp.]|nr:Asp-tRNA(Asn)/Glu-tRNA(Gln) amidotransferase subunit GatC [Ruminococcus sp.]